MATKSKSNIHAIQCLYTLFALAPMLLIPIIIIPLMAIGVKINATTITPIATTLFLLITLKTEIKHKLTDIRRFIPFSLDRKTTNEIMKLISDYALDEKDYRQSLAETEKLLVTYKHQKLGHNISKIAAAMNVPRTTLYSIFKRLQIETSDNEK